MGKIPDIQTQIKIKNLIENNKLVVKKAKLILPVQAFHGLEYHQTIALIINYRIRTGKMSSAQGKSIKANLTKDNAYNIAERHRIDAYSEGYVSLEEVENITSKDKTNHVFNWSYSIFDISNIFKAYMRDRDFDEYLFVYRLKAFFKHMPYLNDIYEYYLNSNNLDLGNGYCCADCDGDIDEYRKRELDVFISKISSKLDHIIVK